MSRAARRITRVAARAGWVYNLEHVPRRWPSRVLRWLLMAPFLALITEFHRVHRYTYGIAECSCGRIIHFEDLRWLGWPAWATGCLVAQVHNWINWRPEKLTAPERSEAAVEKSDEVSVRAEARRM